MAQVGAVLMGRSGGVAVAAIVIVCVLGSLAAVLMLGPRVYFAMAQDGVFPAAAAAVHPRFGTPARAIATQAVLASILVGLGTFDTIVAYFIFITVVFIARNGGGRLRARAPRPGVPGCRAIRGRALTFLIMGVAPARYCWRSTIRCRPCSASRSLPPASSCLPT